MPRLPLHFWTTLLAAGLVIWSMAKPVARVDHAVHRYMFVIDITESMGVEDVELDGRLTTRIELVKHGVRKAMQNLHCDSEIAFAIFTEHRSFLLATPVRICENFTELDDILDYMNWQMAWRSHSEIAKGIHSAIQISGEIEPAPKIVFFTDGHESPPIHPDLRFHIKNNNDGIWGMIAGVGGEKPRPIPRYGDDGKKDGYWHKEDVEHFDRFTKAINEGKSMTGVNPNPDYTGQEHLSSIKEDYLKVLAGEAEFEYLRLGDGSKLASRLSDGELGTVDDSEQDIRPYILATALAFFIGGYLFKIFSYLRNRRRFSLHDTAASA